MKFIALVALLALAACELSPNRHPSKYIEDKPTSTKPNVILIFIDDMGFADISGFGNPAVNTPNMDHLAKEGLRLTNFYVNSPICSASRVALKTGLYPQRTRIHSFLSTRKHNKRRKMPNYLPDTYNTYAKVFKENGYATAHFGKWHIGGGRDVNDAPLPQAYGYDKSLVAFEGLGDRILWSKTAGNIAPSWNYNIGKIYDLPKHQTTETYVNRAIKFIRKNRERPFLVNVFPNDVHDAHEPSQAQLEKWKGKGSSLSEDKFFAVLDEMDKQIGRLLGALDKLNLSDNTIVILTSDNGPTDWKRYYDKNIKPPGFTGPFFGRKWSLYEGGIRMPFIIRWPEKIDANQTNDTSVVAAMDIFPSLIKIANLKNRNSLTLDGEDMSQALLGKNKKRLKPLFWEYGVYGSIKPGKKAHHSPKLAMRNERYKLLLNPDGSELKMFDLLNDQGEKHDIAAGNQVLVDAMKKQLLDWWKEMNSYYHD